MVFIGCVSGVDLSSRNLIDIPSNIPFSETQVDLSRNKIKQIRRNAFVNLTEMAVLQLYTNDIETIEPGAFNGLANLQRLYLYDNKLTVFPDSNVLSGLSSLLTLNLGSNEFKFIDTTQLNVLNNLKILHLGWIFQTSQMKITPFPALPKLDHLNFKGNGLMSFSGQMLTRLSGLKVFKLGYNKISSLHELSGQEGQIRELGLPHNRFLHVPDFSKYASLVQLDLSDNFITLVPQESLSHIQSGTVNLEGNPVICVSELCWLVSGSWPFEVQLTCPDETIWADVDPTIICEGTTPIHVMVTLDISGNPIKSRSALCCGLFIRHCYDLAFRITIGFPLVKLIRRWN